MAAEPEAVASSAASPRSFGPFAARPDKPPSDRKPTSHHKGASKQDRIYTTLVSYYGLAAFAVSRLDQMDGEIIATQAEACAGAWVAAGKANPKIQRVLEIITVGGPYMALVMVHAELAVALMARHGTSPLALFRSPDSIAHSPQSPNPQSPQFTTQGSPKGTNARGATMPPSGSESAQPAPAPFPYQPVGANAPTEAPAPPPVFVDEGLRVVPDEGIPAEIDVALRQMARQSGRPYEELRQEALLELAQMRMQAQSNGHTGLPGALGAPIVRE